MMNADLLWSCCCLKKTSHQNFKLKHQENLVSLDPVHMGQEVVILKNGTRACGSGGVILSQPLLQSKSYFEVKIQQEGHWSLGVCTLNTDLNKTRGGLDQFSWCINAENYIMNSGTVIHDLNEILSQNQLEDHVNDTEQLLGDAEQNEISTRFIQMPLAVSNTPKLPKEGDIIGVTYDHVELNFHVNGKNLNVPTLIKINNQQQPSNENNFNNKEIYPCLYVDDGAILDVIVDNFKYQIPSGYEKILVEQTLL